MNSASLFSLSDLKSAIFIAFPSSVWLKESLFLGEMNSTVENYNSRRYSHLSCKKSLTPEKEKEEPFFFIRIKAWAAYMFAPSVS